MKKDHFLKGRTKEEYDYIRVAAEKRKGLKPWNKGLTKETDERVRNSGEKGAKTNRKKYKKGELKIWNEGMNYHLKPHIYVACDYCGEEVDLHPYEVNKTKNHFCNRKCFSKWLSQGNSAFAQGKGFNPSNLSKKEFEKLKQKCRERGKEIAKRRKGKTYEQIYGKERALEEKLKRKGSRNYNYTKPHKSDCTCCICKAKRGEHFIPSHDHYFMGAGFNSRAEKEVALLFFNYLKIIPIQGLNCHILVGNKSIDFYIYGCFIEFHPMAGLYETRTREEYYRDRRKVLDDNGYDMYSLVHSENEREVKEMIGVLCKLVKVEKYNLW